MSEWATKKAAERLAKAWGAFADEIDDLPESLANYVEMDLADALYDHAGMTSRAAASRVAKAIIKTIP